MTRGLFPQRIDTDRLTLERLCHDRVDPFELYAFVSRDDWGGATEEHMPWFGFERLDQVVGFIDHAEERWAGSEGARYLLRSTEEGGDIVGTSGFSPEWDARRAGSDVVLAKDYWGREYGVERASAFVELTFEQYDLDAFFTTHAADNEPSRRMIETHVERYGGRHEGLLRQHSPRPDGEVTDQHRYTITREEYETATANRETRTFELEW